MTYRLTPIINLSQQNVARFPSHSAINKVVDFTTTCLFVSFFHKQRRSRYGAIYLAGCAANAAIHTVFTGTHDVEVDPQF